MPDRRGAAKAQLKTSPRRPRAWARETWADRNEVARLPSGAWMLREAAKVPGLPEEAVDELLRRALRDSAARYRQLYLASAYFAAASFFLWGQSASGSLGFCILLGLPPKPAVAVVRLIPLDF